MELFASARFIHIAVGAVALASFWLAAAARKGGRRHRQAGRVYLLAMSALLSVTLLMAAGNALGGNPLRAVFNVYVTLISVCSVWLAWRSIRDRHDIDRYRGGIYKSLCALLAAFGLVLLALLPGMGEPARMALVGAFACLGLATAGAMLYRIVRGADHPQWWLSEHLTGMALNFAATHASFSILGLGAVFPVIREPWLRTSILMAWMMSALLVRLWVGRRFKVDTSHPGALQPTRRTTPPLRAAWLRAAIRCRD
jgi:uncharacterized membrane protein